MKQRRRRTWSSDRLNLHSQLLVRYRFYSQRDTDVAKTPISEKPAENSCDIFVKEYRYSSERKTAENVDENFLVRKQTATQTTKVGSIRLER